VEDQEPLDADEGEELEAEILRANRPYGADRHGVTAEEAREGDSLERELALEGPDGPSAEGSFELSEDDAPDDESELVGDGTDEHDPFVAPEETALTVRDDAPGATDHADDYVEPDEP